MDNDVRFEKPPVFVTEPPLGIVLDPLAQPGLFKDPFEDDFPPGPLCLGVPLESPGQVLGILAELLVKFLQSLDFLDQGVALLAFGRICSA